MENMENMFILIDGNKGIYIPKVFVQRWGNNCITGLDQDASKILLEGPAHDDYFNVWDGVVDQIEFLFDGQLHTLYEDQDLFAVPVN